MPDALPSRRELLAGGLTVAFAGFAGCLGVFGDRNDGDESSATGRLEFALHRVDGPLHEARVVSADDPPDSWADGAFEAAVADDRFTTQYRKPFFARADDPVYARHDGAYYELDSVIVDEVAETRPVLRLSFVDEDAAESSVVDADSLPGADRDAVRVAHMAARARGNPGGYPVGLVQRGGYVYRRPVGIDESRLLADDGPEYVRYRDRVHAVSVQRERFHEPVYRATAERLAERAERMEAILRAHFVAARFGADDVSADARELLQEAMGSERYAETHPYSDAYVEVLRAMDKRPYVDGNVRKDGGGFDGTGMLRYDGTYYDYILHFSGPTTADQSR